MPWRLRCAPGSRSAGGFGERSAAPARGFSRSPALRARLARGGGFRRPRGGPGTVLLAVAGAARTAMLSERRPLGGTLREPLLERARRLGLTRGGALCPAALLRAQHLGGLGRLLRC